MYKFVFRCPARNERIFWYVSTRAQGEKMVYDQLHRTGSRRWPHYRDMKRDVDFFVDIVPQFRGEGLSGADIDNL